MADWIEPDEEGTRSEAPSRTGQSGAEGRQDYDETSRKRAVYHHAAIGGTNRA
ncbi:hypothetical protein [Thermacetogenium phaeum]|uniref:hypothetical protein n=1 Tax=Thermacetogenium phaeum TaxID=85874 RepID=UPI00138AB0A2|nr:hypothetical protein [Thermacetogenium phaeum]